jgi:anti-sigma B factor antagonist
MPVNIRMDGDIAILSNFARLMNDPRYFDAVKDVNEVLDQGLRKFVLDLGGVREIGESGLGLLTTLTRQIRKSGGEVVVANMHKSMNQYMEEMRMDTYWEMFESIEEAKAYFGRGLP